MADRLKSGPTALYAQLSSIMRSKIMSGEWFDGAEIPTLNELCEQYQVARVTARQATQALVTEGLLTSQRGRRTFVTHPHGGPKADGMPLFSSIGSLNSEVTKFSIDIRDRRLVDELPAGWFTGRPEGAYVMISKSDREGETPYAYSDIYVAKHVFDAFPKGAERRYKLARLVRDYANPPIVGGSERIRVAPADFHDAKLLDCQMSAPVARARRILCDADGRIVYYSLVTYRGDRFEIEHDLSDYLRSDVESARARPPKPGRRSPQKPAT